MMDRIDKRIELKAPVSRVWRALTDYREFGAWFGVNLETPFAVGQPTQGRLAIPGYEKYELEVVVRAMEPERLFAYHWHPYALDESIDYSKEEPTLVEFRLEKTDAGTLLLISESGFDRIPAGRRAEAFRMNEGGWSGQIKNIEKHLAQG
jgi:uncharacterized protein YndB with AHSA1/START domain